MHDERVGLELQLKSKARELNKLETDLTDQTGELDDLVFALEASNTENKYLHDEITRLKRASRQSIGSVTQNDKDPKTFMKNEVLSALTSYRQVVHKNETAAEEQKSLRQQMLEQQSDPAKVVEMLATNMGYWLLGQAGGGDMGMGMGGGEFGAELDNGGAGAGGGGAGGAGGGGGGCGGGGGGGGGGGSSGGGSSDGGGGGGSNSVSLSCCSCPG